MTGNKKPKVLWRFFDMPSYLAVGIWSGWPTVNILGAALCVVIGVFYGYAIGRWSLVREPPHNSKMSIQQWRFFALTIFLLACVFMLVAKLLIPIDSSWGTFPTILVAVLSVMHARASGLLLAFSVAMNFKDNQDNLDD